jgi:hypothetical protein
MYRPIVGTQRDQPIGYLKLAPTDCTSTCLVVLAVDVNTTMSDCETEKPPSNLKITRRARLDESLLSHCVYIDASMRGFKVEKELGDFESPRAAGVDKSRIFSPAITTITVYVDVNAAVTGFQFQEPLSEFEMPIAAGVAKCFVVVDVNIDTAMGRLKADEVSGEVKVPIPAGEPKGFFTIVMDVDFTVCGFERDQPLGYLDAVMPARVIKRMQHSSAEKEAVDVEHIGKSLQHALRVG